jgi:hypothetical protein
MLGVKATTDCVSRFKPMLRGAEHWVGKQRGAMSSEL